MPLQRTKQGHLGPSVPANGRNARYVVYPESNGRPIAETQLHLDRLLRCLTILEDRGAADPFFFVAADLFLYYEEGNPKECVAPDVSEVRGVPKLPLFPLCSQVPMQSELSAIFGI